MKRLLQISFDTFLSSFISILVWIILSLFMEKEILTIFILTYPIQYISSILKAIFGTGANITAEKEGTGDVLSGITIGIVVSVFLFGVLFFNVDRYCSFMNSTVNQSFVSFSILEIFLQTLLGLILTKLYYENKNKEGNYDSIVFHLLTISSIFLTCLFQLDSFLIITITITILSIYVSYLLKKAYYKFKFVFNVKKWLYYNSVEISDHFFLFLAYLFGITTSFISGEEYGLALTFVALITDTQWDITGSILTAAKIDISKNQFSFKEHLKSAYRLIAILLVSVAFMYFLLVPYYTLNGTIVAIYLSFHIIDFLIYPLYSIETVFLQLDYSNYKIVSNNIVARFLRFLLSFLKTPFCTVIAQLSSSLYQLITITFIRIQKYEKTEDGTLMQRNKDVALSTI